ncbi:apolipoprotein N-acyltransferase [Undibacterium sp. Ren11W]|uniref:apolipoprotein N-acyltransferase n=1 Tax=Undibacterium sp. Ren11W TaxID=3413045 RepID=UPI003BF4B79F
MALLAGCLNVLSFAPFHFWPLECLGLALLFFVAIQSKEYTLLRVALLGWSYGFGAMFCGISWLIILMTRYNDLPLWLSLIGLALLASYLAIFAAIAMLLGTYLQRRWKLSAAITLLMVFPAIWAISEWLRGWVLTGFPWLASGYAHTASPLAGYAAVLGVYGVGWISAVIAASVAVTVVQPKVWKQMFALIVLLLVIGAGLRQYAWTQPTGQTISVRLLQGNVDQNLKFDMEHVNESLRLYHDMIVAEPADLIATPETALPLPSSQLPIEYLPSLNAFTQASHSRLLLGLVTHDGPKQYSNSALGFGHEYQTQAFRYDKHHLVPFGEFIPFGFRWFINMMKIPFGELSTRAELPQAMQVKDQYVLPNICYESLFGEEISQQLRMQSDGKNAVASILLNMSNLAWYGDSIAIPQHLQISQMRSLETGRPMLQATNTGATAVINAKGEVIAQIASQSRGTLSAQVQGMRGVTPYILYGNASILALASLSLLLAFLSGFIASIRTKKLTNKSLVS